MMDSDSFGFIRQSSFCVQGLGSMSSAEEAAELMALDGVGHYERLGVDMSADDKAIKQAYRQRAKELHPDKNKDDPDAGKFTL